MLLVSPVLRRRALVKGRFTRGKPKADKIYRIIGRLRWKGPKKSGRLQVDARIEVMKVVVVQPARFEVLSFGGSSNQKRSTPLNCTKPLVLAFVVRLRTTLG